MSLSSDPYSYEPFLWEILRAIENDPRPLRLRIQAGRPNNLRLRFYGFRKAWQSSMVDCWRKKDLDGYQKALHNYTLLNNYEALLDPKPTYLGRGKGYTGTTPTAVILTDRSAVLLETKIEASLETVPNTSLAYLYPQLPTPKVESSNELNIAQKVFLAKAQKKQDEAFKDVMDIWERKDEAAPKDEKSPFPTGESAPSTGESPEDAPDPTA